MRRRFCLLLTLVVVFVFVPRVRGQHVVSSPFPLLQNFEIQSEPASRLSIPAFDMTISPNLNVPRIEFPDAGKNVGLSQIALESTEYMDPRYIVHSLHPDDMGIWESFCTGSRDQLHRLKQDFHSFYLTENMAYVGVALAAAAPLANTHADEGIRQWYQRGAGPGRSPSLDEAARFFKWFGHWQYVVPACLALSFGEHLFPDSPAAATIADFGNRSVRAMAVGAPTVGILQPGLGASRPFTGDSRWRPFDSNKSVSGHAFIGAIPFLTAASMTDSIALKTLFVAGSFGTAWTRIHDDDHYFSQVFLGWVIAYLSVETVTMTEMQNRHMRFVPVEIPNGVGLGVELKY